MSFAFNILIILIAASPVLVIIGDPVTRPLEMAAVAFGIVATAFSSRQADANHIVRATSGIIWVFPLVLALIVAQLLPLPLSWSNPIWASAAEALPTITTGHLTLDVGRTFQALLATISTIAVTIIALVVARDRRRAELILLAAGAITTLLALAALIQIFFPLGADATVPREATIGFSYLGVLLGATIMLLAFERSETRGKRASSYLPIGFGGIAALLVNAGALYMMEDLSQWIATALGLTVLLLILAIRRLGLARWSTVVLCGTVLAAAVMVIAWLFDKNPAVTGLLRFTSAPDPETLAILQRLLADSQWIGSGACTFDLLARIYQGGEPATAFPAPTMVVAIIADAGWMGLLVFAVVGLGLFCKLFWGALERGRDWFFPAMAASAVAAALSNSLMLSGLFQPPLTTVLAIIAGVGLSQGFSQMIRQ